MELNPGIIEILDIANIHTQTQTEKNTKTNKRKTKQQFYTSRNLFFFLFVSNNDPSILCVCVDNGQK